MIYFALSLIQALTKNIEEDVDCKIQTLVIILVFKASETLLAGGSQKDLSAG